MFHNEKCRLIHIIKFSQNIFISLAPPTIQQNAYETDAPKLLNYPFAVKLASLTTPCDIPVASRYIFLTGEWQFQTQLFVYPSMHVPK